MPRSHTFCRICEAACGLVAKRDETGALVGLRPDKDHPASKGFACAKGTRFVLCTPIPDFEHADLAVVFGSNPYVSQSSFVHLEGGSEGAFAGIEKRGGTTVWVDPRRTESAKRWGRHLPIRPATDAWLLLVLLVIGGDPLRSIPGGLRLEGALDQLDFLACIDMFESRTAAHADAFLPATSWLERWDVGLASIPFQARGRAQLSGPLFPLGCTPMISPRDSSTTAPRSSCARLSERCR